METALSGLAASSPFGPIVPIGDQVANMEHIRTRWAVPADFGGRFRFIVNPDRPIEGTILGASIGRLLVLLDGDEGPSYMHPAWEVEYITP